MKILFPCPSRDLFDNPFIDELVLGLRNLRCKVCISIDEFWNNPNQHDIIHIQWPNAIFNFKTPTKVELNQLETLLSSTTTKIVYTRHNEKPHYNNNENLIRCYQIIEKYANCIIHLGEYNLEILKKQYSYALNVVIPHHIYENTYNNTITKEQARSYLGIDQNKFVILTFGAYRDLEEANMVLTAFKSSNIPQKILLAPSIGKILHLLIRRRYPIKWLISEFKRLILARKGIFYSKRFIPDSEVPFYFSACDVVLIQRKDILNSGNLPLAFYFSKPTIGPNRGNVGLILKRTNNYTFEPDQINTLVKAIDNAYQNRHNDLGRENYEYAKQYFKLDLIAQMHKNVYNKLIAKDEY